MGDREPLPRLESGGATALVTALAFGPQGELYAGGLDKAVRVWRPQAKAGQPVAQPVAQLGLDPFAYRVPIGPGPEGGINAIALSPDGEWLAVGGLGVFRGGSGFKDAGIITEDVGLSPEQREDRGVIYLFNTRTRTMRQLRGHLGESVNLAFAASEKGKPPLLVSAAREPEGPDAKLAGVVRVWDVAKGTSLARLGGLPEPRTRPGLAVRHAGPRAADVRVALAWNDGVLRVWDVAEQGQAAVKTVKDGANNITVAFHPSGRILSGSFVPGQGGRVQAWTDQAGRTPEPDARRQVVFREEGLLLVPRALTLVPSGGDGAAHVAVALGRARAADNPPRIFDFVLRTADVSTGRVTGSTSLWRNSGGIPTLAASADGRRLAMAGESTHSIHTLPLPLQENAVPTPFGGVGVAMNHVAFVRRGKDWGLLVGTAPKKLGEPRDRADGDLVFDVSKRALGDAQGWEIVAPPRGDWQTGHETEPDGAIRRVWARQGNQERRVVELEAGQQATDYVLIPPAGNLKTPLLAVAFMDPAGYSSLLVYNLGPATPEPVRQYRGHVEPIRGLAVSPDSRLLASTALDQTVCVWSLIDLPQKLGQFGYLPGVGVTQEPGGPLVVARVNPRSPYRQDLAQGDVIEGRVLQGKPQAFLSAREFVDTIITLKPGEEVRLRIQGKGDRVLRVGQLTDERKPLFSLFLTRGKAAQRDWLAWTPVGPFDSSGQDAERYLGWHFNPEKAGDSTAFALAGEYRDKYYRPGLLQDIIDEADLNKAMKRWLDRQPPPPKPGLTLWIEQVGPQPDGDVIVRQTDPTLRIKIDGLASLKDAKSVTWRLDGQAEQTLWPRPARAADAVDQDQAKAADRELSTSLKLPGVRGRHQVRVTVTTQGFEPVTKTEVLTLRYLPPRPLVRLVAPAEGEPDKPVIVTTEEPRFTIEASIAPGLKGEAVAAVVRHRDKKEDLPAQADERTLRRTFELSPGENLVEIVAINAGADKDHAEHESGSRRVLVGYRPKEKAPPPRIVLEAGPSPDRKGVAVERGKALVVHAPELWITGKVESEKENLSEARLLGPAPEERKELDGFKAGQDRAFAIKQKLNLKPGAQHFRFAARSANSDPTEVALTVEYQPPLPGLSILEPKSDFKLYDDRDKPTVKLVAELTPPAHPQPFEAVLTVNGKDQVLPVKPDQQRLEAEVGLRPGENLLQLRLSNAWKQTATANAAVSFKRPPRELKFTSPAKSSKPLADVTATVRSPRDLKIAAQDILAMINDTEVAPAAVVVELLRDAQAGDLDAYQIRLKEVPLVEGKNRLELCVSNGDSACREPAEFLIEYEKPVAPPPPRPVIEFLSPRLDTMVTDEQIDVRFRVSSTTPLKGVELYSGKQPVEVKGEAGGIYLAKGLKLQQGANLLRAQAKNDGGQQEQTVTVSYSAVPVRLDLDKPASKAKGSRVQLQGHVSWQKGVNEKDIQVRVFVNGSQQPPARLTPGTSGERRRDFVAEVELDREKGNRIEFELPGFARESGHRPEVFVDSEKPAAATKRTLHLLLVGVGETRAAEIARRAQSILAEQTGGNVPDFDVKPVVLTGPEATSGRVRAYLNLIQDAVNRSSRGSARDVVLVYWAGKESIDGRGHSFLTSDDRLHFDDLAAYLDTTLGKRFLFLDVVRGPADAKSTALPRDRFEELPRQSHIAGLRVAWQGQTQAPEDARLIAALQKAVRSMDDSDRKVSVGEVARVAEQEKKPDARVSKQLQEELADTVLVRSPGP